MSKTNFDKTLSQLNRGELNAELTDALAEVIKAVRETRKQGTLTLSLKVSMLNTRTENQIKITPMVNSKIPELDREESIVFSTADGDVLFDDPSQLKMDLKTVENKPVSGLKVVSSSAAA
ncbi:hypothetical protein NJ8700_02175 [Aggregatibacter aphrophilus NJ8700]|uniref:Uncharacterized protein n=1 Tax=Aggregatibacter aphrophilus (strain NJ8700) TaxID=634176 RepID=C6ALS6_AGGAN|nr:hypothetical protein [Aggregatibacter aphrophilus]ABW02828.1 hypothetical protein Hap62p08 [Aggregatibacter aphrophilus NJ8700]ACS96882.1 conserved hypothetical protein [Aggregatibacter aphrophilus NJ8700]AKS64260.1 hypothetical protein NJ8700_02175 [Aggregatibacter aphrophilus NJ8700]PNL90701.1 hypothetical protein A6J76_011275 [Aggregatibacter aphrophilus]PNL93798.1 hypothetical protein A6J76_007545 [Aggregatibacter aphrophilus]